MNAPQKSKHLTWRHRVYEVLDHGPVGDRREQFVSWFLIVLVLVNVGAIVFESVPRYEAAHQAFFIGIEVFSLVVFTAEYVLRIWVAAEHAPYRHLTPMRARLNYMLSVNGVIDLVSILPFWLAFMVPAEFRVVLLLRIVRFLKLARYSPAMRSLLDALYAERRALVGCLFILFGATLITATFMHLAERHAQPDKFGTIPDAMWWAIVTLGTIGYGDVVPITPIGKMIAAATIICGLIMIALPVGIIATAFSNEIHRRDFVVTWSGCRCSTASTPRRSPRSCGCCGRRRPMPATSSSAAAMPRSRCISSPPARSQSKSTAGSTRRWASAISSARWRSCAGRGALRPCGR
jgi:voltage-gated potassium channel